MKLKALVMMAGVALASMAASAQAETSEVTIAKEYGIGYLPYMIMEHEHLIEKEAQKMGLGNLKVNWSTFGGSGFMQSALLAGKVDFASSGVTNFVTMWAKSNGAIKSAGALDSMPLYLVTNNPKVKSVKDFTEKDKIAVPTPKTSIQAIYLQMAAAQVYGQKNATKLDSLTVALKHPDATAAVLSGAGEIDSHFSSPPFQEEELKNPRVHAVLNSYNITHGPATFILTSVPVKFYQQNPKTYQAVVNAIQDAENFINKNKPQTAAIYLQMTNDKHLTQAEMVKILGNREYTFTMTPQSTKKLADFMHSIGSIKTTPASWKDLYFPNVHRLPGS